MPRCLIALGGNLGPVHETFAAALRQLDAEPDSRVLRSSSIHHSAPIGDRAGAEFRNAAAEIETDLPPLDLLDRLRAIETGLGRTRDLRWGPRTLDLDLITYGSEIIDLPRLRVPHPACWYRRFVLDPVVEIAADTFHPDKGVTFGRLRARLLERPLRCGFCGADHNARTQLIGALQPHVPEAVLTHWEPGDPDAALLAWLGPDSDAPEFASLPRVPRLDASAEPQPADFLRYALFAALGR